MKATITYLEMLRCYFGQAIVKSAEHSWTGPYRD